MAGVVCFLRVALLLPGILFILNKMCARKLHPALGIIFLYFPWTDLCITLHSPIDNIWVSLCIVVNTFFV